MELKRINHPPITNEIVEDIEKAGALRPAEITKPVTFERTLSTGSTLLDLAVSGNKVRGGGVPPGILVEIYGESSTGKTAIMGELMSCAQKRKGKASLCDSEGRFDLEHRRMFDVSFDADEYHRPDTVSELFSLYDDFSPDGEGISVFAADSLAAFSTDMEMEDEDKMGMRRAKEFSAGLRKYARRISEDDRLMVCTNQVREGSVGGVKTMGGKAVGFYASLRIQLRRAFPTWRVKRTRKLKSGQTVELTVGIMSDAVVMKSSIDRPFREAPIFIDFGYGVDDVRANLQWLKDMSKDTAFGIDKATRAQSIDKAIEKVEAAGKVEELKWEVVDLWEEIQELFTFQRTPKDRG